MTSPRPVLWISKRTILILALIIFILPGIAFILLSRQSADDVITDPAKRIARALATQDLYLRPDSYKADLTWDAYQQLLVIAGSYQSQNAREPINIPFVQYGTVMLLDQGYFGNSITALVQVIVKNPARNGAVTLYELQLPMIPEGTVWKVGPNITTFIKGEIAVTR
ncbi:MAG: hypothetical protein HZB51_10670 [Chloroflexi bacterium]|nr:hypothetical protein [Chloroflexota bacterium]